MTSQKNSQTAFPLLRECWLKGVTLTLNQGKLTFKAAKGVMDQALLAQIRTNKALIIEALTQQPDYFAPRPLGLNEKSLWFLYRMAPESSAYNMAYAIKLNSRVTLEAVQQAFVELLKRHPILSSAYGERDGDPVQWLATSDSQQGIEGKENSENSHSLSVLSLNNANQKQINGWVSREADKALKLDEGQVCRGALLANTLGDEQHLYLTMVIHHIAADFMSFEVLRQELVQLLGGQSIEQLDVQPVESTSYRDWCAKQQQSVLTGEATEQFWLAQLADLPQLNLPTDFPHSAKTGSDGEEIQFNLTKSQGAQLRQQCRQLEVTPYVWFMSAFQWFMGRLSGQDDFIIGTPSSGRLSSEDARLVGYLVNPLALRCRPDLLQGFDAWVAQVDEQTQQVMRHQGYPFSALIEKLDVKREAGRSPVFQHMFTLNHERPEAGMQGIVEAELLAEQRGAAHDLNLVVVDNRTGFLGKWRYNNSLYRRETVESIRDSFIHFINQLLTDVSQPLASLDLASTETASVLVGETLAPVTSTAWNAFANIAQTRPDNIALKNESQSLSYADLMQKVDLVAVFLQQKGINSGKRVGICLERSVEQIVAMLACWRVGATYVAMDHKWPDSRLQFICQDAELVLVVGHDEGAFEHSDSQSTENTETPSWLPEACLWVNQSTFSSEYAISSQSTLSSQERGDLSQTDALAQSQLPGEKDVAYVIYTSGSTGQPKGVEVSQSNLIHYVTGVLDRLQLSEKTSLASLASNGADLGYTAIYGALLSGRTLRLLAEDLAFDAEALAEELAESPVDCLKIVPSHLNGILLATERSEWLPNEALILGGEAISPELVAKASIRNKTMSIFNHYGPTETTIGVVAKKLDLFDEGIALGRPLANVETRVVDACGRVVPQGFAGELEVSGPTLANGYLGQAELTKERFHQVDGKSWYRTGDRVKQVGEALYFIGRSDFQVKIRGYRVEPGEVEAWLKQHLDDAVVLNVPDERQNNRLVTYIVASEGKGKGKASSVNEKLNSLKANMLSELPDYMVPAVWIPLERLPLLGNGKLDRKALPDADAYIEKANLVESNPSESTALTPTESALLTIWQTLLGKPALTIHDNFFANGGDSILGLQIIAKAKKEDITLTPKAIFEHQTVAELALVAKTPEKPENKLEKALLEIAKEVLGKSNLTAKDNFFAVGGDSILSLQIIAKAKAAGIALTPKQVFEHQTMAELALAAQEANTAKASSNKAETSSKEIILPSEPFALTPIQAWFFEQQSETPQESLSHWNQSLLLDASIDLDLVALRAATLKLVERHPSLRLAFSKGSEQSFENWQQIYQPIESNWGERLVQEYDGEDVNAEDVNNSVLASLQSDFKLDQAPLVKFVWLSKSKQLLCAAHHLIMDAVSWQVLLQDLHAYYKAALTNQSDALSATDVARFDQWQDYLTERASQLDVEAATAYWSSQIQTELPQVDANNTYQNSQQLSLSLSQELTHKLLGDANVAYKTRVQELLLTALAKVLGQWQQLPDVTIELEGHGRESGDSDLDLSTSIGWFTSRFPQKLSAVVDWESALIHNKEQLRRLPDKGLEYGLLRYLSLSGYGTDTGSQEAAAKPSFKQTFNERSHSFVSFNYLGQQDGLAGDSPFSLSTPLCPGMKAATALRPHVLDINAVILSGELHLEWTYPASNQQGNSENSHDLYACVPDIAENYMNELVLLIEHCCHPNTGRATAVDFPDADITDAEFIDLLAELEA
ncbi:amino acid adenylation domain-containing protein [Marinomonas sp. PE14-40]|uniref:amino acid adenylation domain-containing protein n=1 Tax=Marinomonas sp. PE14-40 TaxID=3060621 RepID=UPI003F672DC1